MLKKITNVNIQNFLYENDYFPVDKDDTGAEYYKETKEFFSLLDSYYIRYGILRSRI